MKRFLYIWLLLFSVFYGCERKEDTVFEETADERLTKALTRYQTTLSEATDGWNAFVYPQGGSVYSFYLQFDEANRVKMYADINESTTVEKESSYRLKAMQTPSLIFDTYSYLHILADPDDRVNGGVTGEGLRSDFEFSIQEDSIASDRITLVGRRYNSRMVLTKATPAQRVAYEQGALSQQLQFGKIAQLHSYFKRASIGGTQYEISYNAQKRTITLTWFGSGGVIQSFTSNFYYNSEGLQFVTPLVVNGQTISGFTDISWVADTKTLNFTAGTSKSTIVEASAPLKVDVTAGRNWWQMAVDNNESYWVSWTGFHINGVDDALKVSELATAGAQFAYYIYWPYAGTSGTTIYDIFAPVFYNPTEGSVNLVYGNAPGRPTFTTDGRVVFSELGTIGSAPFPTNGPAYESASILYNSRGFYFVRTSEDTFDMISASDARIWISWQFL